jgi:acyl carrier protein
MYGPTENTVFASRFAVKEIAPGATSVSVGRPISNTQIFILDRKFHLVPVGMVGEVLIGGDGLAVHYFNRPGLTADRFIPHPFSDEPGARLYRTGDLACYEPDGKMEFLGRVDHQVKFRGFRIELEEVEAFLSQHPAVRDAVALMREDAPGDKRLVAYVVPDQTQELTISQLRHFLKKKLPDYMVPSIFIMLDNLPLTPNGKVDHKALPATDGIRPDLAQPFVAPRDPVEKKLADIWAKALGLERVGIHDDFFALGGHSLLATQIVAQLREALQVDLPLAHLFERPTIAELAQTIEPEKSRAAETERPTLQPISRADRRMKRSALDRGDEAEK